MVEEHSANLTARIDSDYPSSIPPPVSNTACPSQELKLADSSSGSPIGQVSSDVNFVKPLLGAEEKEIAACDLDVKCISELKKDIYKSSRPNSIESRRSKSLCNTSSVESNDDVKGKKDVKKTKSNPVKCEGPTLETTSDKKETVMTVEEKASPAKDRSSPENPNVERQESPKPGCSNQPEIGNSATNPNFVITFY